MPLVNNGLYHYTECGLDNVYLTSGFTIIDSEHYGQGVSFNAIQDLHKRIVLGVLGKPHALTGSEIRFLRIEMDKSQKELGTLLGVQDQTVSLWERGKVMPWAESLVLRQLALERCCACNTPLFELIDRINTVNFDADKWAHYLGWNMQQDNKNHWGTEKHRVA